MDNCAEVLDRPRSPAVTGRAAPPVRHCDSLKGQSAAMSTVKRLVERVADTDSTVLILGESGTGKPEVAKMLAQHSDASAYMDNLRRFDSGQRCS